MPQLLWFKQRAHEHRWLLFVIVDGRQRRHVARALRHRRHAACTATSCPRRGACTTRRIWDCMTFVGTIGLFLTLFFLFVRFLPMISIFEMRTLVPEAKVAESGGALMATTPDAAAGDLRPDGRVRRRRRRWSTRRKRDARGGLPQDRRVLAVSDRRGVGGDAAITTRRLSRDRARSAASPGCSTGFGLQDWVHDDRLSDQHRGQAAQQLAAVRPGRPSS